MLLITPTITPTSARPQNSSLTTTITTKACPDCGRVDEYRVAAADYRAWVAGVLIQDAFPYLDKAEREQFLSGLCGPCFSRMPDEAEWEHAEALFELENQA